MCDSERGALGAGHPPLPWGLGRSSVPWGVEGTGRSMGQPTTGQPASGDSRCPAAVSSRRGHAGVQTRLSPPA